MFSCKMAHAISIWIHPFKWGREMKNAVCLQLQGSTAENDKGRMERHRGKNGELY